MRAIPLLISLILCIYIEANSPFRSDLYRKFENINKHIKKIEVKPKWHENDRDFYFFNHQEQAVKFFDTSSLKVENFLSTNNLEELIEISKVPYSMDKLFSELKFVSNKQATLKYEDRYFVFDLSSMTIRFETKLNTPVIRTIKTPDHHMSQYPQSEILSPRNSFLLTISKNKPALRISYSETLLDIDFKDPISEMVHWKLYSSTWLEQEKLIAITNENFTGASTFDMNYDWSSTTPWTIRDIPYVSAKDAPAPQELYIINTETLKAEKISTGKPEHIYYEIREKISNTSLIFSTTNKFFSERSFYLYDSKKGINFLFTEKSKTYLMNNPIGARTGNLRTYFNKNYAHFLSEQSGRAQIYRIDLTTGDLKQETRSPFSIDEIISYDEENDTLYFQALGEDDNPYHLHVYKHRNGKMKRLTQLGYTHGKTMTQKVYNGRHHEENVYLSPDYSVMVNNFSNLTTPNRVIVKSLTKDRMRHLGQSNDQQLLNMGWKKPIEVKAYATDNKTKLHGVLHLPSHFDPNKKYPIIDFIYGGPQYRFTTWNYAEEANQFAYQLAELGFIVLMMDARGTPDRNKNFTDFNYKKFGQVEVFDHKYFIEQIAKDLSFIDISKVGVIGSSYGGYQTLQFVTRAPKFFKVAVANAAVADIRDVHSISSIMYMGDPITNSESYEESAVINHIDKLEAKLLIIHGARDYNAPLFGMMKLMQSMVERNIYFDQFIDPITAHSRRAYTWQKIARYFHEHLEPVPNSSQLDKIVNYKR